jgi:hypothetical protein
MAVDSLNRTISFVAVFFAFIGVILGVVALATNYWTMQMYAVPATAIPTPNGTFLTNENVEWAWNVCFNFSKIHYI